MFYSCEHCGRTDFRSQRGLTQHQGTEPCKSMAERALGLGSSQPNTVRMEQARAAVAASIGNRPIKTRASTRLATFDHDVFEHGHTVVAAKPSKSMQEIRYKLGEDELGGFDHQNSEPEAPRKDRDNANESDDSHLPHTDDDDYLPFGSDSFEDDAIPFAIPGGANPNGTPTENGSGCIDLSANFVSYCSEGLRPKLTEAQVTGVRLMDALRRNRAPLKAYKDLSEWHLKENGVIMEQQVANDAGYHYVSRETLIKMLMARYGMKHMFPKEKKVKLPSCKEVVTIPYHEAKHCIERLLTDPRITPDHYNFFQDDPRAPPPEKEPDYLADIITGDAFYDTYNKLINEESGNQLMGCLFYIDGAATGLFADLPVTILKMSLTCLTREARLKDYCWVPLGYVPHVKISDARATKIIADTNHMEGWFAGDVSSTDDETIRTQGSGDDNSDGEEEGFDIKAQDFHTMLEAILESYYELQKTGFYFELAYKRRRYGIPYLMFCPMVKCDTEEGDTLCGKYLSRTKGVKHICRTCNIPTQKADKIKVPYQYKTQTAIQKLIQSEKEAKLKAISQHLLKNAWYKVRFNLGNDRGIHGACPSEMLHAVQLGIFKYVRDIFFELVGKSSGLAKEFNALGKAFGRLLAHQSDRSFGSTNFTKGIMEGKLMAKDYRGVLLNMAACLQSQEGQNLLLKRRHFRNHGVIQDWILLLETLLEWEAYLHEPRMQRKHLQRLRKKHQVLMYLIKKVAPRTKGMGLKIMKYHAILHMVDDICLYGVPLEFDTAANESHHKPSKAAAKLTQRNLTNFNIQVAVRLFEFMLIDLALLEVEGGKCRWEYYRECVPWDEDLEPEAQPLEIADAGVVETSTGNTRMEVFWDQETNAPGFAMLSRSRNALKTRMCDDLIQFLWDLNALLQQEFPNATMEICTEHRRDNQIFHGHPNYRGMGAWNDWVMVNWGPQYGKLPCHISCFVVITGIQNPMRGVQHGGIRLENGTFSVVEATAYEDGDERAALRGDLFIGIRKEVGVDRKRVYYLADVAAFDAPCCCIPDLGGPSNRYYHVPSRTTWAKLFIQWLQEPHAQDDFSESDSEEEAAEPSLKRNRKGRKK